MICPNCKETINDGSKFCEHCGANLADYTPAEEIKNEAPAAEEKTNENSAEKATAEETKQENTFAQGTGAAGTAQTTGAAPATEKKPLNKNLIIIIAAAVVVIAIVLVALSMHKNTIDLQDYTTVEFSGYEGYGTAYVDFDYDKFIEDVADEANIKTDLDDVSDLSELSDLLSDTKYTSLMEMYYALSYEADVTSGLKNGDTVTVTFSFDNDAAGELGLKFKGDDMEVEVSGLSEIKEVNPFDDITVEFSGTSPDASATVVNNSSDEVIANYIYFSLDKYYDIAKGDTVTVTVDSYDEEYFVEQYGYKLTETSKEFVCEDVDYYITDTADIDEDVLDQMKGQTEDVIEAYFANESDYLKSSDLTYVGYYFLTVKDTTSWNYQNIIYVIYSTTVKSLEDSDDKFEKTTVYMPVKFTEIVKYSDGTSYVDLTSTSIEGSTDLEYSWWSTVKGYESISSMENELVSAQKGDYTTTIVGDDLQ